VVRRSERLGDCCADLPGFSTRDEQLTGQCRVETEQRIAVRRSQRFSNRCIQMMRPVVQISRGPQGMRGRTVTEHEQRHRIAIST
jgi:hypothetical protein